MKTLDEMKSFVSVYAWHIYSREPSSLGNALGNVRVRVACHARTDVCVVGKYLVFLS